MCKIGSPLLSFLLCSLCTPLLAVCIKYDLTGEKVNPSIFYNSCMQEVRILEVVKGMENFHEEMVLANNELVKKYHLSEDFLWK